VTPATWTGYCTGCNRDGLEVSPRASHHERVLCDSCATRPFRVTLNGMEFTGGPRAGASRHNGKDAFDEIVDAAVNGGGPVARPIRGKGGPGHPDRYSGRVLNVREMLAQPDEPIPWRCEGVAADGYLTVVAGRGGEGKSWLALALACGVARGEPAAGIDCAKGRAVIFDAENGPKLIMRRFRAAGVSADLDVQPVDAGGLRLPRDLDWFREVIEEQGANLAVFDSLRVLSSGVKENDGDALEPIITDLKLLARETGVAVLLVHHRGKADASEYRGSSVILDQTDMLYTLGRVVGDQDGKHRRKITTIKCRIDEEPEPRWLRIEADRSLGLVYVNEAEPCDVDDEVDHRPAPVRERLADQIEQALEIDVPARLTDICLLVGRKPKDGSVRNALQALVGAGRIRRTEGGWCRVQGAAPPKGDCTVAPCTTGLVEGTSRGGSVQ
jgi:hypothetical protein